MLETREERKRTNRGAGRGDGLGGATRRERERLGPREMENCDSHGTEKNCSLPSTPAAWSHQLPFFLSSREFNPRMKVANTCPAPLRRTRERHSAFSVFLPDLSDVFPSSRESRSFKYFRNHRSRSSRLDLLLYSFTSSASVHTYIRIARMSVF